jgi:NAD(P)-dependent dehydrogenase (short-subunit alcohol dehydrogenase family)
MKGKTALMIGGGGGSGRLTSLMLAKEGVKVVVGDIDRDAGQGTVDLIKKDGGEARFIPVNAVNEEDIIAAVKLCEEAYGGLHYAANIIGTNLDWGDITTVSTENFEKMTQISTRSVFFGIKYEIPAMLRAGGGSIVNMACAGAGRIVKPFQGSYSTCKFGVLALTKTAALAFADKGIRVNCVGPQVMLSTNLQKYIDKDPHFADSMLAEVPMKRFIEYSEVSATYMFLFSELAGAITGMLVNVDGGDSAD